MVKYVVTMETWDSLPHAKFCKNFRIDSPLRGKFILKFPLFTILGTWTHIYIPIMVKFSKLDWTKDFLVHNKFVRIPQGTCCLGANIHQKFQIMTILGISSHISLPIMVKFGITEWTSRTPWTTQNFVRNKAIDSSQQLQISQKVNHQNCFTDN